MPYNKQDILGHINRIGSQDTLLDMLVEFEKTLDNAGLFAYRNWELGELVEGPNLSRYWISTTWMYPKHLMPDPDGGLRLLKYECKVKFVEDTYIHVSRVLRPSDAVTDGQQAKKAKEKKIPVWLVTIEMPRRFVDESHEGMLEIGGQEIDIEDIHAAWDNEVNNDSGEEE